MPKRRDYRRRCNCCQHPERARMESLCARGASVRSVAAKFGVKYLWLLNHWHKHTSEQRKMYLRYGHVPPERLMERLCDESEKTLDHFMYARSVVYEALEAAREAGDRNGIGMLIGRLHENLIAIAKLNSEWSASPLVQQTTNITQNILYQPQFNLFQAELIRALSPFPDARAAVLSAFAKFEKSASAPVLEAANGPEVHRSAQAR